MKKTSPIYNPTFNKLEETKIFSFSIVLILFTIFFINFVSAFSGGIGTAKQPYEISTCTDLQNMSYSLTAYYVLVNDINCSATKTWPSYTNGRGFIPIGSSSIYGFQGTFDGKGYNISNLYILTNGTSSLNRAGLFTLIGSNGVKTTIKNIDLISINVTYKGTSTTPGTGGVAGSAGSGGRIINVHIRGGNVTGYRYVGGLVGESTGANRIEYSSTNTTVTGNQNYGGGLTGVSDSDFITDSYSLSKVRSGVAGGLAGSSSGVFNRTYATGKVTGSIVSGGLSAPGGYTPTVVNSFWDNQTTSQNTSEGSTGKGKTTAQMMVESTFTNWDFNRIWIINRTSTATSGTNYPLLRVQEFSGGIGNLSDPYRISTCTELQSMNNGTSLSYVLLKNVDCIATATWHGKTGFIPIGNYTSGKQFSGTLNGSGYTVSNIFINRSSPDMGLIGFLSGTVTDIGLEHVNITKRSSALNNEVGALVGYLSQTGVVNNSYATGNLSGNGTGNGGLVGLSAIGIVRNSYSGVKIVSSSVFTGGLIGAGTNGATVYQSYSYGKVNASFGGGLQGASSSGTFTNSFWDNQTSGKTTSAGGTGKATAQMKTSSTYTNWDFLNNWRVLSTVNSGYPFQTRFKIFFTSPTTSNGTFSGNSINATVETRVANADRIYVRIYNSSGLVASSTNKDSYLTATFSNLKGGTYYLNATVNDSNNVLYSTNTRVITFDTTKPRITINKPAGTQSSLEVPFNVTLSDNLGLSTCKYWVTRGQTVEIANTTVTCGSTVTGSFSVTLNAVYSFHFHLIDVSGNGNQTNSSFTVSTGLGGGGGGSSGTTTPGEPTIVTVVDNRTFCGDLICQANGNDYGANEDFYSCPIDCKPFDLDAVIFSFTRNCFDANPATICVFGSVFGAQNAELGMNQTVRTVYKNKQICTQDTCEPLGGKTLTYNCFAGKPCFWNSSSGAIVAFMTFLSVVLIGLIRLDNPQGKGKISGYSWVKVKLKKRRR